MKQLIACCGLDCENCDARIATINNDDKLREETAQKWSVMNNTSEITPETIHCPTIGLIFQHNPSAKENLLSSI